MPGGDDAHLYAGLGAHQTPQQAFFLCCGQSDIVVNLRQRLCIQAVEVSFLRNHKETGHVRGTGRDGKMALPFRIIALRTGGAAERNHRTELAFAAIGECIEAGLRFLRQEVQAVQEPVKQLGHGLGRSGAQHEDTPIKRLVMIQLRIPYGSNKTELLRRIPRPYGPEQPLRHALQRHVAFGAGLEVGVLRNRGSAVGAVIKDDVIFQLGRQIQHVRETVPDGLRGMDIARNDQMIGENGRPVYQNIVLASLPALERQRVLVLHVVFLAQRTAVVEDGHAPRIGLKRNQHAPQRQGAGTGTLERPVLGSHARPHRQLVMYEFVDI